MTYAANHFQVTSPTITTAGAAVSFTVTIFDMLNETVVGYTGTVYFTSSDSQGVLPPFSRLYQGVATFSATLNTAGSQTLRAADILFLSGIVPGSSAPISVAPAATSHFAIQHPTNPSAGIGFPFTVLAEDAYNNPTTGFAGTIHFFSSDSNAILPPDSTISNGAGTFSATLTTIGSQSLTAANATSQISFVQGPQTRLPKGTPGGLVIAEFNGDGSPDLAFTNANYGAVNILLGNGNGTFQGATTFAVGSFPFGLALGEFNSDDNEDLAVANAGSNTVSVLLGNGNGTFAPGGTYAVGEGPSKIVVGDFTGDGNEDLAVTDNGSDTVSVLLGNGNGTFQAAVAYTVGYTPLGIAAVDVNNDGHADLEVACPNDPNAMNFVVLLGNGNGTFGPAVTYNAGSYPAYITTGDFNGDGNVDLAVAPQYIAPPGNEATLLLGNGNGTFRTDTDFQDRGGTFAPHGILAADFTDDGSLDLAIEYGNVFNVLLGNGNGTFGKDQLTPKMSSNATATDVGDFNGDGLPDIVVANIDPSTVSVLLNQEIAGSTALTINSAYALSINRASPLGQYTTATSVSYAVTFDAPVTGVAPSDFQVTTDGSLQAASPVAVSGSGSSYTVTVNGIHGSGDLRSN